MMSHLPYLTDEELLQHFPEQAERVFSEIYNRYWKKLYVVAYNRLRDDDESREVVQEVFLNIWKRRARLQINFSLSTYLSAALKYRIINKMASLHREQHFKNELSRLHPVEINDIQLYLNEKELIAQIQKNVQQLPKKCRIVFQLSRNEGKNIKEIAKELQISEKTVEAHLTKAIKHLRKNIKINLALLLFLLYS